MELVYLKGTTVENGRYLPSNKEPRLFFRNDTGAEIFAIDEPSLFRNILLLGAAGSGKTNIINQILPQLRAWKDDPYTMLVFDTKADYVSHPGFFRRGDYILGSSAAFRDKSQIWNIFDEVLADGDDPFCYESNAKEIAAVLFTGRGSATQPFFAQAAQEIFAGTLIYFVRRSKDGGAHWKKNLNNRYLTKFLTRQRPEQLRECFSLYDDLGGLATYFGDGSNTQSLGVFGELRSMMDECFQGVFAMDPGEGPSFSIRRAIREKQNRAIFLEYDMSAGERLTPMYRLIVDLALKEALSNTASGRVHLLLDELKLLPKLNHLHDALNYGRSKNVSVVAGIQNVNQLYAIYGEARAGEILEGFATLIALKTNDHASREYVSLRFGPNKQACRYYTPSYEPVDCHWDGRTVEHWHQQELQIGEAVVGLASQTHPFLFRFMEDKF